ncbi:MAG: hypothetical protein ACXVBO_19090 [Isosphaeraceae bacterium]
MKITRGSLAIAAALLALASGMSLAEAGRRADCRHGAQCYKGPGYVRPYAQNGWFNFRFFRDYSGPCGPLLRKAIEIDTPDPRYWNAYDSCIGL